MNRASIPWEIKELLQNAGKTVAIAESISAGHLQAMLSSVPGISSVFQGGITAYKRSVKVQLLQVDNELAKETDCVDRKIAEQMALGCLKLFNSDYAISTCGYAEVDEGHPYAFIAVAQAPDICLYSGQVDLAGHRIAAQIGAAEEALGQLHALLRNKGS